MTPLFYKNFVINGIVILLLISCSSTSIDKRYNKKVKENEEKRDNSVRFSSINDPEFDEKPVEEILVDQANFAKKYSARDTKKTNLSDREKILSEIVRYINIPYQYGGETQQGIDCSAFTKNVFKNSLNFDLPRTANKQFDTGTELNSYDDLTFGDLVFFDTTKNSFPGHVGIYLGDQLFAHSSFSRGVTVSSMNNQYYVQRYIGARRVIKISY